MHVILDWDGSAAVDDTLIVALHEFGDWEVYREAAEALRRREITLHEEIARDASSIRTPLGEVQRWLVENVELRPGFHELVGRYPTTIVSSNFRQLIEPVLAREGVELEVRANEVEWHPDGWRASFPTGETCGTCGEPCKRAAMPRANGAVAYVGDGYSDRCAAQLADRIFARAGLARYLDEHDIPYEPYEDLHQVVRALED